MADRPKWPAPWKHDTSKMVRGLVRDANGLRTVFIPYGPEGDIGPITCKTVEERSELAEKIVRAVNAHDALVAALRDATECLGQFVEEFYGEEITGERERLVSNAKPAVAAARRALASVEAPR